MKINNIEIEDIKKIARERNPEEWKRIVGKERQEAPFPLRYSGLFPISTIPIAYVTNLEEGVTLAIIKFDVYYDGRKGFEDYEISLSKGKEWCGSIFSGMIRDIYRTINEKYWKNKKQEL